MLYNRGMINAMLLVESIRTRRRKFGKKPLTGEQVRWGIENLNLDRSAPAARCWWACCSRSRCRARTTRAAAGAVSMQWDGTKWGSCHRLDQPDQQLDPSDGRRSGGEVRQGEEHHSARLQEELKLSRGKREREGEAQSPLPFPFLASLIPFSRSTCPPSRSPKHRAAPASTVNNIEVIYDHVILVLKGVSLQVREGQIVALLGANGAGKIHHAQGDLELAARRARRGDQGVGRIRRRAHRPAERRPSWCKRGGVQVMEGRHCFAAPHGRGEPAHRRIHAPRGARRDRRDLEKVYAYFPRLKQRRHSAQAGYTSGGEQQMTAIGRALMARPRMILLDEPSMGLAPQIVEEIFEIVRGSEPEGERVASCWPSRTPTWRCATRTTATSSRTAAW